MSEKTHLKRNCFFDGDAGIQRYDVVKHQDIEIWNNKGLSFFWRPEEVDVTKDKADFTTLDEHQKFIFTSTLKRQIKLDTVQGREPVKCFMPLASLPEVENAWMNLSFQETIHSRSYTHILRNVYDNPSEVFDTVDDIPEIVELADELNKYYDALDFHNTLKAAKENGLETNVVYDEYAHKKAFYLALISANALEGIRFYLSFACSWAFAQVLNKMEGNAKIIKLIARDENQHFKFICKLLDKMFKEDQDFVKIRKETMNEVHEIYATVVRQEKEWAKFIFQHGDMLGLDYETCCDYIDLLAHERMAANGYNYSGDVPSVHPIPWIEEWITTGNRQVALQESENDSYLLGVTEGSFYLDSLKVEFGSH